MEYRAWRSANEANAVDRADTVVCGMCSYPVEEGGKIPAIKKKLSPVLGPTVLLAALLSFTKYIAYLLLNHWHSRPLVLRRPTTMLPVSVGQFVLESFLLHFVDDFFLCKLVQKPM